MSVPVRITKSLTADDPDGIATSQTPVAGGPLTLDGNFVSNGVAVLDTQRRVLFTFAGDESTRTFTVTGTNGNGQIISEEVAGAASPATASTELDYLTVTSVTIDAASAGAIEVGTSSVGATDWFNVNWQIAPTNLTISVVVDGTVTYSVQVTYDDVWGWYDASSGGWTPPEVPTAWDDPTLKDETDDGTTVINAPITAWRVIITTGTGSVDVVGIQAGISQGA